MAKFRTVSFSEVAASPGMRLDAGYYLNTCEHHFCRSMRANELAEMGRLIEAIEVHNQRVTCRKIKDASPDI